MHLIGSTILAWLNLASWLVVSVVLWGNSRAIFGNADVAFCVLAALVAWLLFCAAVAFRLTERCARMQRCRTDPEYAASLILDLKSDNWRTRQLALQILADHCGQPLSLVLWPPFGRWARWQFKRMPSLLKRRRYSEAETKVHEQPAPQGTPAPSASGRRPILEPLSRGAAETLERLSDAIKDTMLDWTPDDADAEPAEVPLPPLHAEQFVEALRGPCEVVLSSLAETINAAPDARAVLDSRERGQQLFNGFLDEALELGLKLRVDAAVAELPVLQTSSEWHAAEPALRGPTHSWVEKFRRMKADESNWF